MRICLLCLPALLLVGCAAKKPVQAKLVITPDCAKVELASTCDYNNGHPKHCDIRMQITCTQVVK